MDCKNCKNRIPDDSKYCPFCGTENVAHIEPTQAINHKRNLSFVSLKILLISLAVGVWILVFQNFGIIPINYNVNIMKVKSGTEIGISGTVDANLQYINGHSNVFFNNPSRGETDKYYVIPVSVE